MGRTGLRVACSSEPVHGSTVHIGLGTGVGRMDGVDVRGTEMLTGAGAGMAAAAGAIAAVMSTDTLAADTVTLDFMERQDFMVADTMLLRATTAAVAFTEAAASTVQAGSTVVVDSMVAADADNSDQC